MEEWARCISELGLGAALALMMFVAFFFLLKWVLKASSEQLQVMAEERKAWRDMQAEFSERIRDLQEGSRAFNAEVRDAHKYQRDEHQEMIKCLGRINGYN
jgi:C4-dicarboxylate-specific signal transduction histidine kinase